MAEAALAERIKLAGLNPLNSGAQGEVAEAHAALGQIYAALGQKAKAKEELLTAKQSLEELVQSRRSNAANIEAITEIVHDLSALGSRGRAGSTAHSSSK